MDVLAQKHVEKNPKREGKTDSKISSKSYVKQAERTLIYRGSKTSRYGSESGQIGLSIDRPVDRPGLPVHRTQVLTCRWTDQSIEVRIREQGSLAGARSRDSGLVDRPVDRP